MKEATIKSTSTLEPGEITNNTAAVNSRLTNWAGNYLYSTSKVSSPQSISELKGLIKNTDNCKILGSRHCFNSIADSNYFFISLDKLDSSIELDTTANTVTVSGAVRYGELADFLFKRGYALHNLASLPHISIAGACATATHGSGSKNGNLATVVRAMQIITANGEEITLSQENDGEQFFGAVVNLGAIGVITKMTLEIQPAFMVRQDVFENLPFDLLKSHFDEIMASGYSVSLFTDWRNSNFSEVWVKSVVEESSNYNIKNNFFSATPAKTNLHPIVELSAENCTEQLGVPGPSHDRLPHFKMGFTPSSGKEIQSEYFIAREHSYEAILAVQRLSKQISSILQISEIRTIAADNFWMSPCYKRDSTGIHFTWKQDWESVQKVLPLIEQELEPFNARPHWGKMFTMPFNRIQSLYHKLPEFQQLVQQYDAKGKFRNEFLTNNIFGI